MSPQTAPKVLISSNEHPSSNSSFYYQVTFKNFEYKFTRDIAYPRFSCEFLHSAEIQRVGCFEAKKTAQNCYMVRSMTASKENGRKFEVELSSCQVLITYISYGIKPTCSTVYVLTWVAAKNTFELSCSSFLEGQPWPPHPHFRPMEMAFDVGMFLLELERRYDKVEEGNVEQQSLEEEDAEWELI